MDYRDHRGHSYSTWQLFWHSSCHHFLSQPYFSFLHWLKLHGPIFILQCPALPQWRERSISDGMGLWLVRWVHVHLGQKKIQIETDHKPLVSLLGIKRLDNMPPRILRFRLRLSQYEYDMEHVPGKFMYTVDTLSRTPLESLKTSDSTTLQVETKGFIDAMIQALPATEGRLESYCKAQS